MDMTIKSFTGGIAQTNGYLLKKAEHCVLIDAPRGVRSWLGQIGERPTDLLLTHQHYDHVEDVAKLAEMGLRIHAHSAYSEALTLAELLKSQGIPVILEAFSVNNLLEGKSKLDAGGFQFFLEHVPGHAPDSLAFLIDDITFVGDALFSGSVGRTDLPGGDMKVLLKSVRDKLLSLPDETRVFPGHGPETNIGKERTSNPFL